MADRRLPSRLWPKLFDGKNLKVLSYGKLFWIEKVVEWLDEPQLQRLRASQFGRLFDFPQLYTFSGTFVHFILSRMLSTKEAHQLWFIFGGKPWRFSIREYAIATGLKCTALPPKPRTGKSKCMYWDTLFPDNKSVSVTWMITTLNSGRITDPDMKLRYVALFLAECFLCAKSHETLITEESVELVEDIDAFLSYPWGTLSFSVTIESILKKIKYLDRKPTLALQGFLLPLQIVAFLAVPSIAGTLVEPLALAGQNPNNVNQASLCLRLSKIKELEDDVEVDVIAIIAGDVPNDYAPPAAFEDIGDKNVRYLVKLIEEDHDFDDDMWGEGLRKVKHVKRRPDGKGNKRKTSKRKKASCKSSRNDSSDSPSSDDDDTCDTNRKRKRGRSSPSSSPPSSESEDSSCAEPVKHNKKSAKTSRKHVHKSRTQPLSPVKEGVSKVPSSISPRFVEKEVQRAIAAVARDIKTHITLSISDLEARWEGRHDERFEAMEKLFMQQLVSSTSQPKSAPTDVVPRDKRKGKEPAVNPLLMTGGTRRLTRSSAKILSTSPTANSSENVVLKRKRAAVLQVDSLSASTNSSDLPPTNDAEPNPTVSSNEGNDKEVYNPPALNVLPDARQDDKDYDAGAPQFPKKTVDETPNTTGSASEIPSDNGQVDEDVVRAAAELHNETVNDQVNDRRIVLHASANNALLPDDNLPGDIRSPNELSLDNGTAANSAVAPSVVTEVLPSTTTPVTPEPSSETAPAIHKVVSTSVEDKVPVESPPKTIQVTSNAEVACQITGDHAHQKPHTQVPDDIPPTGEPVDVDPIATVIPTS